MTPAKRNVGVGSELIRCRPACTMPSLEAEAHDPGPDTPATDGQRIHGQAAHRWVEGADLWRCLVVHAPALHA